MKLSAHPLWLVGFRPFFLLACLAGSPTVHAKDFLRAQGTQIVDASGKPVILRGMGLGGWMLQEGYMLDIDGVGTQRSIHARIAGLIGPEKAIMIITAMMTARIIT